MTFSGRYLLNILNFAHLQGVDVNKLLSVIPFSIEELDDEKLRVESDIYNRFIEIAVEESNDPCFGLHLGDSLNLAAAGLITQIVQSAPTVLDALNYCCEFSNLACRALNMNLEKKGAYYKVNFIPDPVWKGESEVSLQHTIDAVLAFTIKEFRTLIHKQPSSVYACISANRTPFKQTYEQILNAKIEFGNQTYLLFHKSQVEQKIVSSDFYLLPVLVDIACKRLEHIQNDSFEQIVKTTIVHLFNDRFPTIEEVANNLNKSTRSLQRYLKEEGSSFKKVLNEIITNTSNDYLKQTDFSVNQIAHLLGYSDSSAFNRAYKKLMGITPQEYRNIERS